MNRGYVFCSRFLSDDEAIDEFKTRNPNIESVRILNFDVGVRGRTWVKNVVALGNAAGFVEPLEATAIGMVCDAIARLIRGLKSTNGNIYPIQKRLFNRIVRKNWEVVRDFLAVHYRFNDRLETPFWNMCRNEVDLGEGQDFVDLYRSVGPDFGIMSVELARNFFGAEGYITLLLGQQVPFAEKCQTGAAERKVWADNLRRMGNSATRGIGMQEYLSAIRTPGGVATVRGQAGVSQGTILPGQLKWH